MRAQALMPLLAAVPTTAAIPQLPDFANTTVLPSHFAMVLFPHFQALDVFGPLDVLNTLSMLYSDRTNMTLTLLSRTMDPVGTVVKGMPGRSNFGEDVVPTNTFANVLGWQKASPAEHGQVSMVSYTKGEAKDGDDGWGNGYARRHAPATPRAPPTNQSAPATPDIEVLLVPGGGGTRQNVTEEIAFVKEIYPKLKYIISVCTGASILARAGILDGRNATTNKRAWAWVQSTGPNVNWVPTARWVEDGNIFSSSGISAGIDVTFAWVSKLYGDEVAEYLANTMEYERWTDPHKDPFSKVWEVPGAE